MRKKDLTEEDLEYINSVHKDKSRRWDDRMSELQGFFGCSERNVREWLKRLKISTAKEKDGVEKSEQYEKAKKKKHNKKNKYFLVTWAQNNTDVNGAMMDNMEAYADFLGGEILVIAGRYRNPTSLGASKALKAQEDSKEITWDKRVLPYLTANRHNIHKYLMILGDVKAQPTADTPLTGFEGFSGLESSILGHPKQHLKPLPILEGYPHKVLTSTGSVTKPNYTDTKAGKKGEFNHIYGFIVVEIKNDDVFYLRNVNVDDSGEFNDLFFNIKKQKVSTNKHLEGINLGDSHFGFHSKNVMKKTHNLLDILKPKKVILEDVFDGYSISHHHEKDPFLRYSKANNGANKIKKELETMFSCLSKFKKYKEVAITRANHDEHLDRYLRERDWKKDIDNSLEYMKMATVVLEGKAPNGIIPYLISQEFPDFICLGLNDSYMVKDIECALHGDKGANGARGSSVTFKKLNTKTITGHTHTPEIRDGAFIVGTSTKLRLSYNKGLSSWMQGHVTIDSLGKRQQILFFDDDFTTLYKKI